MGYLKTMGHKPIELIELVQPSEKHTTYHNHPRLKTVGYNIIMCNKTFEKIEPIKPFEQQNPTTLKPLNLFHRRNPR